jgi:hypothetical protein
MEHSIIYRQDGAYAAFPILDELGDDRLSVGFSLSHARDHACIGEWTVLVSDDGGRSWAGTDDPTLPQNWPGDTPREKSDRFAAIMSDGSYLCAGTTGWETWSEDRADEARSLGLRVLPHRWEKGAIIVSANRLFVQRSKDQGRTWDRREWAAPGFESLIAFSRATQLADGTALVPVYGVDLQGKALSYVWRSDGGSDAFRLLPIGPHASGVRTDETCFLEVSPGRVLAHSRNETGYLSEMWSEDAGKTWSHPTLTEIWTPSSPPHLLKLTDGRILCSFGYRREPMGVRAVLSSDSGETWDIANTVVLRDDGGTPSGLETPEEVDLEALRLSGGAYQAEVARVVASTMYPKQRARADVGYAQSAQLSDGSIVTVYYITLSDGVTYSAATRWEA